MGSEDQERSRSQPVAAPKSAVGEAKPSGANHTPGPEYAAEAYRACLYGRADARQQQSVAAALILANGSKGELLDALQRLARPAPGVKMLPPWAVGIARAAIARAETR